MFRCFLKSIHNKPFFLNNSNPSGTFSTTAYPALPKPLQNNKNQHLLLSKPQNFIPPLKQSPSLIPLNDIVNHCKRLSHSLLKTTPIFPKVSNSGSFDDLIEHLVSRYKHSSCPKDAKLFHLNILKHGFDSDLFLCNTLINVHVRIGDWVSARKLFDEMPDRNGVTWACLISGYTRNGMPENACGVLKEMIFEGFLPNRFAFGSAIRACQESELCGIQLGMQIHGLILKSPYANDASLCNVLISMYGKYLGYIDHARSVFDEIEIRNSISWNSIVSVYSQRGDAASCFELFSSMQTTNSGLSLKPNEYTFGSLITAACSSIDFGLSLLEQMLARIKKSGSLANVYVGSALVGGFSRLGSFDHARKIFEQMTARNAVSMNGLMVGLVRQKRGEEAVEVFKETRHLVDINIDSYVILLSACAEFALLDGGRRKGREVHGHAIRTGLNDAKVSVGNGLINMYAKCGDIDHARSVFGLMVDKDLVSWNSMISGLDQNKCFEDAVKSYNSMRKSGLIPSNFALISVLSSCASLGCILLGQQTHGEGIKLGLDLDVSVSNTLLALYAETGRLAECQKVFSWMLERDQVSWNTVIGAVADSGASVSEAVEVFLEMMRAGWSPNRVTFINLLATVSSLSTSKLIHQIHALILKYNVKDDNAIENALLACYGKSGEMENCEEIFSRMSERRDERGQRLDCFTFATVLSACATVATLERGMEVHACTIRACLESDVVIGSALVDMYSKCGRIDYASRLFYLMPMPIKPNILIWRTVLGACGRVNGRKTELGRRAAEMLFSMDPQNAVNYVLLSNMYASGGKWEDMAKTRRAMREAAVKKEAGCSWVTMKDGVHVFVAGDDRTLNYCTQSFVVYRLVLVIWFIVMEPEGSEIDEFERALESALDGSTEEDEIEEGEYSDDDEDEEGDDDEENALDSMKQNQQFEYEALAEKKRKTLADAKGEGSGKKARLEDMTGASLAEIEEIMNFGLRKRRRRRMPKRRGRRKGSKNKLGPEITRMLGDATLNYAHGNYEEALMVLSEVVKQAPLVADSYHTLGLVHKALGNTEKAMKFYRIAAFLRPKDSSLWKLLFSWHIEQGDVARAWKCLSKAISADPDDSSLRSLHALFYDELGDHQRAAESYEQIVRICPEDVEAIKTAAKMYLKCGQIKRCVGILEDYLKGHPSEADLSVIILLADVFMEIDAHSNALQHIEHAHMIYYSGKELPLELMIKAGICQVFLGNIDKAEIHFSALQQEDLSIHPKFITKVADAYMSTECFHSALKYYHMLELNVGADNVRGTSKIVIYFICIEKLCIDFKHIQSQISF
ncbi:hypothetical protein OIU77_004794 [Salix suchowensis]|uniref:Uncharacterized protein n=1 Tax=Salix suchowensis TaxID=1278906 RepID=A0ABQ9AVM2_9ROSI|nr:hypothetical protein OIU77_004794 [Salix suchowensis]